jgi:DNA-binding transcriptional ArsR family regulator
MENALVKAVGESTRLQICRDLDRHRGAQLLADVIRRLNPKHHFAVRWHARRLAEAGAITLTKRFDGERVETRIALTAAGKAALRQLRDENNNLEERLAG